MVLKNVLNRFRVVGYSRGWTAIEEFDGNSVLSDYSSDPDVVESLSSSLRSMDRMRYYLMKPGFFSESLPVIIKGRRTLTLPSLLLE